MRIEDQLNIKRGDMFYIAKCKVVGSEQYSGRPGIVVSNNRNNLYSNTIQVVLMTTREKPPLPTHVRIDSAPRTSTALCEQVHTVALERIGAYAGHVTPQEMSRVEQALRISLGLFDTVSAQSGALESRSCDDENEIHDSIIRIERDIYKDMYEKFLNSVVSTHTTKDKKLL